MDYFKNFITHNFILLFASVVMLIISIQKFKQHKKISLCSILVIGIANILAINNTVQEYAANNGMVSLALACAIVGYSIRPACIYLLIIMSRQEKITKRFWLTAIPFAINFSIYLLGIFPATRELVVYYVLSPEGKAIWIGAGALRFSSHIVSLGYLVWLVVTAFGLLKSKHLSHGITILTLSFFVILCVIIESFFNSDGEIELLNATIALSVLVYYLYLYIEKSQIDALTGLFNRETYYHDLLKMAKAINGVIQFDMNGLKYINDNFGHIEGDKALSNISKAIVKCSKRNMYAYRLGGDEFIILAVNATEKQLIETAEEFKSKMNNEKFCCSIGYAIKQGNQTVEEMSKIAEERMYKDKSEFYKNSHIERRKTDQ